MKNPTLKLRKIIKLRFHSIIFFLFAFPSYQGNAAVAIIYLKIDINSCSLPSAYFQTIVDIEISELLTNDISFAATNTNYIIILTASSNFQFSPGLGSNVNFTGDITARNVTANTITITFSSSESTRNDELDRIKIQVI